MRLISLLAATVALSAFAAHAAAPEAAPAAQATPAPAMTPVPAKDYTILRLNGQEIKNSEVSELWKNIFPGGAAPDFATFDEGVRQNVLRGMVSERLIYGEAVKAGVDKDPDTLKKIENLKRQVIMQSYLENKAKTLVTDEELKKAYDAKVESTKGQEEVHARHILVKSEEEAKKVAADLKKGGDFEKIAKEQSADKASGAQGGDLGYFTKERMVPEFAEAAFKLKKGETSVPVKTAFGWHVIRVEDRRPVTLPSFEEMKESLRAEVQNKAVQGYVEGLLKSADIKYYDAEGKEKAFKREFEQPQAGGAVAPAAGGQQ